MVGTPFGEPVIEASCSINSDNPSLVTLNWNTATWGPCFFQVWVGGRLYTTITKASGNSTTVYLGYGDASTFIEIITVGVLNADENCYHLLQNEYGNRALLKWPTSSDVEEYNVYGDSGSGTVDYSSEMGSVPSIKKMTYVYYEGFLRKLGITGVTSSLSEWKSPCLTTGDYKYAVKSVGYDGCVSPASDEIPITILTYPQSVSGLSFNLNSTEKQLYIDWEKPADSSWTNARIYNNSGSGYINWDSWIVQTPDGSVGLTFPMSQEYGDWKFGVRSYSNISGLESRDIDRTISFSITSSTLVSGPAIGSTITGYVYGINSTGISSNYAKLTWRFNRSREDYGDSRTEFFRLWGTYATYNASSDSLLIDYSTAYLADVTVGFTCGAGYQEQYYLSGPWAGGTYRLGIKAYSGDLFYGPAKECVVFLYGTLPSMVTGITIATSE
jgi:hypothetical protein